MDRSASVLWAPLFCKVCSRRACVVVGNVLMCGDCFFKHSVTELSEGLPDEPLHAVEVGSAHAQN